MATTRTKRGRHAIYKQALKAFDEGMMTSGLCLMMYEPREHGRESSTIQ